MPCRRKLSSLGFVSALFAACIHPCGAASDEATAPAQGSRRIVIFRSGPKILLVIPLLIAFALCGANYAHADARQAAICLEKLGHFIQETDRLLEENVNDVLVFDRPIKAYLPVQGCDIGAAIALSKSSRFFDELFDSYASYTVSFKSVRFIVSFALRKDTGNIEYPAARVRIRLKD